MLFTLYQRFSCIYYTIFSPKSQYLCGLSDSVGTYGIFLSQKVVISNQSAGNRSFKTTLLFDTKRDQNNVFVSFAATRLLLLMP